MPDDAPQASEPLGSDPASHGRRRRPGVPRDRPHGRPHGTRPRRADGGARGTDGPRGGPSEYEVEVLEGLAPLARREALEAGAEVVAEHADGLRVRGPEATLLSLRLASAVYLRLAFAVPRPKALLGDQHLRRLTTAVRGVAGGATRFQGFRFAAAGVDSPVFARLAAELESATGLPHDPDQGELLLRFRPVPEGSGWEVLLRLTPRPLSARRWRVCNRAGGLNATLAAAMVRVAGVHPGDRFLNLMCGSGTLLAERYLAGPAASLTGVDLDAGAIDCAKANLEAAGAASACRLLRADVRDPGLDPAAFDVVVVDLPWGDAVGSHRENLELHPAVLEAADRLGAPGVRLVLLTHELRLLERVLRSQRRWRVASELQVAHGGHHPRLVLLVRA